MMRKYEQFLLLGWLGWFSVVGVTESLCSVIDKGARHFGLVVNGSIAACLYVSMTVLSAFAVRAVMKNTRDFRAFSQVQVEEWERGMKRLHHDLRIDR